MFILHASADIHGKRCNFELKFTGLPSIAELQKKINNVFTIERKLKRTAGHALEPFVAGKVHIFDDSTKKWTRVVNPGQLREWGQLFVTPAGNGDKPFDATTTIPPATFLDFRKARDMWEAGGRMGGYREYMTGVAERAHTIFKRFDTGQKGFLTQEDFLRMFSVNDTGLGKSSIYELFAGADADHDGKVMWQEFIPFFENYPRVMEAIYQRTLEYWNQQEERAKDLESFDVGPLIEQQREKQTAAQSVYANALRELDQLETYVRSQAHAKGPPPVLTPVEEESERDLMARHRALQEQRQRLVDEDARLYRENMAFCDRHGRLPGGGATPEAYPRPDGRGSASLSPGGGGYRGARHPPQLTPPADEYADLFTPSPGRRAVTGNPYVALAMANEHTPPRASPGAVGVPSHSYFR